MSWSENLIHKPEGLSLDPSGAERGSLLIRIQRQENPSGLSGSSSQMGGLLV